MSSKIIASVEHYSAQAGRYERRWRRYLEATARETLRPIELRPGSRLLDVGCGTGMFLERAREKQPAVLLYGLDPTPEMLSRARRRLGSTAELRRGTAECLPFSDGSFDAVVSMSVLHHLLDPGLMLNEVRRVLRPGGVFVLTDWCADYWVCRLLCRCLALCDAAHSRVWRSEETRAALERAEFQSLESNRYKAGWMWGMMTWSGISGCDLTTRRVESDAQSRRSNDGNNKMRGMQTTDH